MKKRRGEGQTNVGLRPNPRLAKRLDQVSTSEQHDLDLAKLAVPTPDTAIPPVELLLKVLEDDGGPLVGALASLPRVDHEPRRGRLDRELTHLDAVVGGG